MYKCLVCEKEIEPFINFGKMPIANGFLEKDAFKDEIFVELKAAFCPNCKMMQLTDFVDRERMFHGNYPFYSSTSRLMAIHFKQFADDILKKLGTDAFVVELGSNDGIMLKNFAERGIRHLGVEPSANVAEEAMKKGVNTVISFFDKKLAGEIIAKYGYADVITAANVICHIPYIHSIMEGIKILLKPDGAFIYEDPYAGDIIKKTSYDQIYDEHAFYFSASSVSWLANMHELELVDVIPQDVHGGSMRYVICHKGVRKISPAVTALINEEEYMGLGLESTYERFRINIERSREKLLEILRKLKSDGKRIAGYAATSKSTTVTNYCGIGPELIDYISDTTPMKQGKYSPGTHIPIMPYSDFTENYPEYALLFAWNHAKEIMAKENAFIGSGGKWIVYVPEVKIL